MLFGQNLKGGTPFWVLFKDAGIVYESFRNKLSNLGIFFFLNESTNQIFRIWIRKSGFANPPAWICKDSRFANLDFLGFVLCYRTKDS